MNEVWRPIPGWEGLYEASSMGQIRSLPRLTRRREGSNNNAKYLYNGAVLKPYKNRKGYPIVKLYYDGREKTYPVHRLVALAFIPNTNGLPMVNHKNEVKSDNRVDNLEWCDSKYNRNYGSGLFRFWKPVKCILASGEERIFNSIKEAAIQTGVFQQNIVACCKGRVNKAGGYKWQYQ